MKNIVSVVHGLVVALAVTATTDDQARFLASAVEMLAAHHQIVRGREAF